MKLGGSVVTRKREAAHVRPKVLDRLARELVSADHPVVLLHGAGSFGHPAAQRYRLARPPEPGATPLQRARGAAIVSKEVRRLHAAVLAALIEAGGRPWSVPPASLALQRAGQLSRFDDRPVDDALARGLLPVLFGDVVPDDAWQFSILSADTLAVELARRLSARRVLFVSDVAGIFDPRAPGRRAVAGVVTPELVRELSEKSSGPDVTGGIRAKAEAMLAIAAAGCDAGLISGLTDGALSRALRGDPVYGSWSKAGAH